MRKKILLGAFLLTLIAGLVFAYDASKLEVFSTGSSKTAFTVRNVSGGTVKNISVAIDINRPNSKTTGACIYWNNNGQSMAKGTSKTVDIIRDMGEQSGATIVSVRTDFCE
jgi:hypothetical protein